MNIRTYLVLSSCLLFQIAHSQTVLAPAKDSVALQQYSWSVGPIVGFKAIKSLMIYDIGVQASRSIFKGQRIRVEISTRSSGSSLEQDWGRIAMNNKVDINSLVLGGSYDWFPFVSGGARKQIFKSQKI